MNYKERYELWLNNPYFDTKTKQELKNIYNDDEEIKSRFYKNIDFGTGGVRALIGAGTNRINVYTIRLITQGFANFILEKNNKNNCSICIAYDSRNMSKKFALETALILNANDIKTYIFNEEKSTPQLSFAVRFLKCVGGVMITASHNSLEYNGYKIYNKHGCQYYYPEDIELRNYINKITDYNDIKMININKSKEKGLYNVIDDIIEEKFLESILKESINIKNLKESSKNLKIVYTPLHGVGYKPISKILKKAGFINVNVVEEQKLPDGNFPTVKYPNPENKESFEFALKLAKNIDADIILATDADADRVGLAIKIKKGSYKILSGNATAAIILEYLLKEKTKNKNYAVVSSIVSTKITKKIAEFYNVKYFEVLTGFKYIGQLINKFEEEKSYKYLFGFEESGGYLIGKNTRDKDSIVVSLLLCEIAAYYKEKNLTLYNFLEQIYKKYGYYEEYTESITIKNMKDQEKIKKFMEKLRNENILNIKELNIEKIVDYKKSIQYNLLTKEKININLQKSDVLYYILKDGSWFCIRPSGTEPKLKIYFETNDIDKIKNKEKLNNIKKIVKSIIDEELSLLV